MRLAPLDLLIMLSSFSSFVKAATRAAARSGAESDVSHTLFLASSPFLQSGKLWNALFCAAARPAAPNTMAEEYLMMHGQ